MGYKYPYIPKRYFSAVMFACKLIREHKTFNKACHTAASYYDVDEGEVRKHVSARAAAGHKGKKHGQQSWFVVTEFRGSDASGFEEHGSKVVRGKSRATVGRRFQEEEMRYNRANDRNGSSYSLAKYFTVDGPFEKKSDAQKVCDQNNQQVDERRAKEEEHYRLTLERQKVEREEEKRSHKPSPYETGTEKASLYALLQNPLDEGSTFARAMLDKNYPGWRDTDLSVEQVYPLSVRTR